MKHSIDIAPPLPGEWVFLEHDDISLFTHRLSEAAFPNIPARDVSAVRFLPLCFYPGWLLCDIKIVTDGDEQEQPEQWHCLLYGSDGFTALDGTSYHLHKHTTLHGVQLDAEDQQIAYLRFFCRFVFGAEGPFEIVTDAADLIFPDNASAEIAPISVEHGHSGPYLAVYRVQMHYAATLFTCLMAIQMGGFVEMLEDEEVSSNVQRKLNLGYVGTGRFRLPNEAST